MNKKLLSDFEKLIDNEFKKQLRNAKKPDGTLKGLSKNLTTTGKSLNVATENIKNITNDFCKKHELSKDEISEINKIIALSHSKHLNKSI